MQWATSLVTLTPTSSPCFIDEAKLNNYPPLNTHTRTRTLIFHGRTVEATGERFGVSDLAPVGRERGIVWERLRASTGSRASCFVFAKLTDSRAESATLSSTFRRPLVRPQTKQTDSRNKHLLNTKIFRAGCEWRGAMTGCQVCHRNELRAIYGLHDSDI